MLIYETTLPEEVVEIISCDPGEIAGMRASPETILQAVRIMVEQRSMAVFYQDPIVVLLRAFTADVGIIHVCFAQKRKPITMLRALQAFVAWASAGTGYHKLEGRTPNLRLALLATHCGAEIEGIRRESFRTPEGMADEYELGYILKNTEH